jgi:hypothetical protein
MFSVENLRRYFSAICNDIRPGLKEMAQSIDSLQLGLDRWNISRDHCRTPEHLILETSLFLGGNNEVIVALHTPLGSMFLMLRSEGSNGCKLSRKFLDDFDWEIKAVTDRVLHYYCYQDDDTALGPFQLREKP